MSSPTTTPPPADTGFDPLVFWIQNKTKVLLLAGLLILGFGTYALSEYFRTQKNTASQELFAKADSVDGYRKVIANYPGTAAAGNAYLMLAQKLRADGKFDDSSKELHTFIEKYPDHPLLSGAWTSIAANFEAQGKIDEAITTYQKVTTAYANSFSAPAALLAQARLMGTKGKVEDARRIYEQVLTQYRDNLPASQLAAQEIRRLKK